MPYPWNLEVCRAKAIARRVIHLWDYLFDYHLHIKYLLKEMVCLQIKHASWRWSSRLKFYCITYLETQIYKAQGVKWEFIISTAHGTNIDLASPSLLNPHTCKWRLLICSQLPRPKYSHRNYINYKTVWPIAYAYF